MKYLLPVFTFLFFASVANAQLTKGNWLVGGTGTFYQYNGTYTTPSFSDKMKFTEITIQASVGYFITDKIAAGLRPFFSLNKGKSVDQNGSLFLTNTKKYGIGPFGRYYFLKIDKPFNILIDASYLYGINDWHGQSGKINTFSLMTGPVIYFNTVVGIEFLFGYTSKKENIKGVYVDNRKGFEIAAGFQIHLEKN
jgi:hypothetical protein